ncbi:MAG: c-type cytochrome [Alphaproteobacteria bacterium]|nr:c-type cytochrome [Alphaproteobacteria bacterium]
MAAAFLGAAWIAAAASVPTAAQQREAPSTPLAPAPHDSDIWAVARGGQLYDNWALALDTEFPEGTHPAYPSIGKQKGRVTWRCKECHGWDYKGEDGAYGKGSHYSGIKGVRRMVGMDPEEILELFTDEIHGYTTQMIPRRAMRKLALFLSKGQIEMDQYIDRATGSARGNLRRGASFFQTVCAICHGFDGTAMVGESETALAAFGDRSYMGAIATDNPWEALHKIRNGQPGVGMVALRALSVQDQVDVLAYMQTLRRQRYDD